MATHWLVRVDFAGQVYLWSDTPVTPVDADGRSWPHLGGLPELRAPSDYDPFQQEPRVQSVSVEVTWPPDDPVGAIIAEGHRFTDSTAEVALWEDGTTYEAREVLVSGKPSEPEYGAIDQPVAFSVESRPWIDAGSTHLETQRVSDQTWPTGDATGDAWYPIVIGRPGWAIPSIALLSGYQPASPARVVTRSGNNAQKLLIAGHAVESTQVDISDGTTSETFNVSTEADGLGQIVAVVDISGASFISLTTDSYTVSWEYGGAMLGPDGAVSGGGDALEWALSRMDYPVDWSTVRAWRRWLNRFAVAGYVDEPTAPWDLITDAWLDNLLPVSVVLRGGRLTVIPWRYDATQTDAIRHIEVAPGLTVPGRVVHELDRVRSVLQTGVSSLADGSSRYTVTSGETPNGFDVTGNRVTEVARTLVGVAEDKGTSAWVGDIGTAYLALYWRAIRGLVTRYVTVQDITGEYEDLADGDVVTLTHADAGIVDALGLVSRDRLSPVAQNLRVIILPSV